MSSNPTNDWQKALRLEISQAVCRRRWGLALVAIGWVHLLAFVVCQYIVDPAIKSDPRHATIWLLDVVVSVFVLRIISGAGWYRDTAATGLVVRVWGTYLILAF